MNISEPLATRIVSAKKFLLENPTETKSCAARIFDLSASALCSSIERQSGNKRGGHNQVLDAHQTQAMHEFIRSLLAHGIQPTHGLVFGAVRSLKCALNPSYRGPSAPWFRSWWRANNLHKIKTKPIAVVRYTAAQEHDVVAWFSDYRQALQTLKITDRNNIINLSGGENKERRNYVAIWRREGKEMYAKGVIARKKEKKRAKNVKELMRQNVSIPDHMLTPIEDSEATWKAIDLTWLAEEAKK